MCGFCSMKSLCSINIPNELDDCGEYKSIAVKLRVSTPNVVSIEQVYECQKNWLHQFMQNCDESVFFTSALFVCFYKLCKLRFLFMLKSVFFRSSFVYLLTTIPTRCDENKTDKPINFFLSIIQPLNPTWLRVSSGTALRTIKGFHISMDGCHPPRYPMILWW